jgi:hypothetical protein
MRILFVLLLLLLRAAAAQEAPGPPAGTEVFTGGGEPVQPREKPVTPVTTYWRVQLFLKLPGAMAGTHAEAFLPLSDEHQEIVGRSLDMPGFTYREAPQPPNLLGQWTRSGATDGTQIEYAMNISLTDTVAVIPRLALADLEAPEADRVYLKPSALIQSADPEVRRRARGLLKDARTVEDAAWALFQYAAAFVRTGPGEAKQDAAAVLRQERGNSAGKARLLTAMLRSIGIPARIVGGLKLEDATKKRATISWVEANVGGVWVPLDPSGGYFGWIPNQYLAIYRGDLPLIVHTTGLALEYDFLIHRTTRDAVANRSGPTPAAPAGRAVAQVGAETVHTAASYVERPVASVVVIADQSVPDAVSERMLREAQADEINLVILHAHFESRYFREQYLQRLMNNNLALIRSAHVLLVATRDDAGLYAVMTLGEKEIALSDMRIVIAGSFPQIVGRVLGAVLYRLVTAGDIVLVNHPAEMLGLWEMVRANVINGVPMAEEARKWELQPLVLDQSVYEDLGWWRRWIVAAWSRGVRAQVPLQALNLILVLPVIAAIIVIVRTVIGIETFGTFAPVIVSLAFLTTGLRWGAAIFAVIVGVGAVVRALLQHVRLQLVARLAILIAVVAGIMAGLTVIGASFGIGALMNISIFPMVIMSNVIENFTTSQAEFGTREAVRLTINTLGLAALCYVTVEMTGLESMLLACPELLIGAIAIDVVLGKWRGLRLLEYARFLDLTRRSDRWTP